MSKDKGKKEKESKEPMMHDVNESKKKKKGGKAC